jgi:chromosome partitioning protein
VREVRAHYGGKVFEAAIGHDPALEEAPTRGESIFDYAPDSAGASAYRALTEEVTERIDRYGSVYSTVNERDRG